VVTGLYVTCYNRTSSNQWVKAISWKLTFLYQYENFLALRNPNFSSRVPVQCLIIHLLMYATFLGRLIIPNSITSLFRFKYTLLLTFPLFVHATCYLFWSGYPVHYLLLGHLQILLGLQHCTEGTQYILSRLLFAHWRAYALRSGEKVLMCGMFCHFRAWNSWSIFRKFCMNIRPLNITSTPNFVFANQQQ
jgi:hypothetical protein